MGFFFGLFLFLILPVERCQVKGGSSFANKYFGFPASSMTQEYSPYMLYINQHNGYPLQGSKPPQHALQHQGKPPQLKPGFPPFVSYQPHHGYSLPQEPKGPWQSHHDNLQQVPPVLKYQGYPTRMKQHYGLLQKPGTPTKHHGNPPKLPINLQQKPVFARQRVDLDKRPQKPNVKFGKTSLPKKRQQ